MTTEIDKKEYIIDSDKGIFKITIPSSWKVTYGRVQPTECGGYGGSGADQFCVRIYETEKQQRAIFTGVKSFRDLGIKLEIPNGFGKENQLPEWIVAEEGIELFSKNIMNALKGDKEESKVQYR